MNPACESSHPIPDNLKLLFRPVAMMLPDSRMIAEVSLYSLGFSFARPLAKKIVETYRLCAEQLSYQTHYEFGMRAVKAVLEAAAQYRAMPEHRGHADNEFQLVLKALLDVNLPKFVAEDVPLFESIIRDLFKDVECPDLDRGELIEAIRTKCKLFGLQATDYFVSKALQLYEMILVRHGVMIIGEPMSCKSKVVQILSEALSEVESKVTVKIINPKSVTMGQLYGRVDPATNEWSDGVLGRNFREMATAPESDRGRKWLLFDGPVDSNWIENLNTVLDDSKKLCLMNGEIIPLSPWMNILFEMSDLKKASPAVVGRSGILFMESQLLGWRPMKQSFIESLPSDLFDEERLVCLNDMFEWLLPPILEMIRDEKGALFLPYCELHLVKCQLSLLKSLLGVVSSEATDKTPSGQQSKQPPTPRKTEDTESGGGEDGSNEEDAPLSFQTGNEIDFTHMQMAFLFSLLWGLCSTLPDSVKVKFDPFFRNLVDGLVKGHAKPPSFKLGRTNLMPDHHTVFDYTLDVEKPGCWVR